MCFPARTVTSAIVILCAGLNASAQAPTSDELVRETRAAVARLDDAKTASHRFTDFDLAHNQNRNEKGKLYSDTLNLYEDTWIGDLPFKRLVAANGRDLTGKDLEGEQRRYDKAVHDRVALDDAARARLVHERFMESGLDLDALSSPAYRLTRLREETIGASELDVIDAAPVVSGPSDPAVHFTLWIAPADLTLRRFSFEVLTRTSRLLPGSHGQKDFVVVDGTPLPSHFVLHALVPVEHETITVDTEHTYSKYRRFTTSTRMLPAADPIEPRPEM